MSAQAPVAVSTDRPIQTIYRRGQAILRVNNAKHANNAVLLCVKHMQFNDYGATSAEVFDNETGELHAVVTHNVVGKINIVFQREVKKEGYTQ